MLSRSTRDMVFILGEWHRNTLVASHVYTEQYSNKQHLRREALKSYDKDLSPLAMSNATKNKGQDTNICSVQENHVSIREISNTAKIIRNRCKGSWIVDIKYKCTKSSRLKILLRRQEFCLWTVDRWWWKYFPLRYLYRWTRLHSMEKRFRQST